MNLELPSDVVEFGRSTAELMRRRAGVDLARRSHDGEDVRPVAEALLAEIEIESMDPGGSVDETLAAAMLCGAAGAVALPYPVVAALCQDAHGRWAVIRQLGAPAVADHADMLDAVVDLGGELSAITGRTRVGGMLAPFVDQVTTGPATATLPPARVALWLNLQAAYVAGALETAIALTVEHLRQRRQFGRTLSSFQALRFALVDASLAHRGLAQLLRFTLWRVHAVPEDAMVDALALRVAMHESARKVLGVAHQLHGAMGFANEHDLSYLTRGVQPLLRAPLDYEASTEALRRAIDDGGIQTLYGRFTPRSTAVAGAPAAGEAVP